MTRIINPIRSPSDVPVAQLRSLAASGHGQRAIARMIGASEGTIQKAMKLHGIVTAYSQSQRELGNRHPDMPPPLSDAECHRLNELTRAAEARRPVWVPREANC